MVDLKKRIEEGVKISKELHIDGLFDITQFLWVELKEFLKLENRFFGVILNYTKEIDRSFSSFNKNYTEEDDQEKLGKILYLYKPLIISEFKRLSSFRISQADCLIIIMKNILKISIDNADSASKECAAVYEIISKLYDNIRNSRKSYGVFGFSENIESFLRCRYTGKCAAHRISFSEKKLMPTEKDPGKTTRIEL